MKLYLPFLSSSTLLPSSILHPPFNSPPFYLFLPLLPLFFHWEFPFLFVTRVHPAIPFPFYRAPIGLTGGVIIIINNDDNFDQNNDN